MISETVKAWESYQLPLDVWRQHQTHVAVAVWHLVTLDPAEATNRLRAGIQRYNAAHGIETTPTSGYHETVTLASIQYIGRCLDALDRTHPVDDLVAAVQQQFPCTQVLLHFYTRDCINSVRARQTWVEPDLQPIGSIAALVAQKVLLVRQYDFNLVYAAKLVEDLTVEQMTRIPGKGLENHAAFTLGHLVTGSAMVCEDLGGVRDVPTGWEDVFLRAGPGDRRTPEMDATRYPSRQELVEELRRQHDRVKQRLWAASEAQLEARMEWKLCTWLGRTVDTVAFMCISHEALHLGQLAAWRRALDLPAAMAGL